MSRLSVLVLLLLAHAGSMMVCASARAENFTIQEKALLARLDAKLLEVEAVYQAKKADYDSTARVWEGLKNDLYQAKFQEDGCHWYQLLRSCKKMHQKYLEAQSAVDQASDGYTRSLSEFTALEDERSNLIRKVAVLRAFMEVTPKVDSTESLRDERVRYDSLAKIYRTKVLRVQEYAHAAAALEVIDALVSPEKVLTTDLYAKRLEGEAFAQERQNGITTGGKLSQ